MQSLRRPFALLLTAAFIALTASTSSFASSGKQTPNSGAVAFRLSTNYKAFLPLKALRLAFGQDGSRAITRVRPKPKEDWNFVPLAPGHYRLAEISTPDQSYAPPPEFSFDIKEGQITYIGDLHLNIKQGAYQWYVRDLHAEDGGEAALTAIQTAQPGLPIIGNVFTATTSSYSENPAERPKPVDEAAAVDDLDNSGVIVLTLAMKKGAPKALRIFSGMVPYSLDSFELTYRTESGFESSFSMSDSIFGKRLKLSKTSEGNLLAIKARSGHYEVHSVRVNFAGGGYGYYTVPFSLPFEVKPGEIVYLGEVYAEPVKKKLAFLQQDAFALFHISNKWDRDKQLLAKTHPNLADTNARVSLLQASGDWREIFISEDSQAAEPAPNDASAD